MPIPSYQQWMNETALGITNRRSSTLKAVDAAIQQYDLQKTHQNLFKIKNALEDWKRSKEGAWQSTERNKKLAISRLDEDLSQADYRTYQITRFSMQELIALQYVHKERKRVITTVFQGKEVTLKAARLKDVVRSASQDVVETSQKAAAYIQSVGKNKGAQNTGGRPASDIVRQKFLALVQSLFSVDTLDQLGALSGVILDILGKASLSVPPVVGHVKDGYDLFTGWAQAGAKLYEQTGVADRKYVIETGIPASAFAALKQLLVEETRNQVIAASQATASFALKTGLLFADGGAISGPVVGAVNALATLSKQLFLLAVEWRATKAINTALTAGELDVRLFRTYPLMGCYLMISGNTSDLIPIDSFGTPGWMDYIENSKREFDEIYDSATRLVEASPWEIIGLPKRKSGTSVSLFGEISRAAGFGSPVSDVVGLKDLKHP
ncbi:MAG: hypothetical protein JWP08_76 [Bryobacterales bacterium]|jgi:hypothetical protein|nr:hypothetical protein [Bryobacterales bacterium]